MMWMLFIIYWIAIFALFLYGTNCYVLMVKYMRNKKAYLKHLSQARKVDAKNIHLFSFPYVTIQLPVFNERYVARRLIRQVAQLNYPQNKLEIQVLDDSTDDTSEIIAELVAEFQTTGLDICHIQRLHREGYKAGALRDGLTKAKGEYIAIFDADFLPDPDFLQQTLPFFNNAKVGLVQTRWGHVNESHSFLTRVQSVAIDGHFGIEQAARCRSGYFLNFNGTGGIWRRKAIEDSGGWQADTLTEDLDLSYRAQLAGWKIEYLIDVEVPAEVPIEMSAFKTQQRRWAKGSIQTALKLIPRVLKSNERLVKKWQALIHLTHYMVHPFMLIVAILSVPLLKFWHRPVMGPALFIVMVSLLCLGALGPSSLYITSQRILRRDWKHRMLWMPGLLLVGTGIAVSNTRAVIEAFLGIQSSFVRTPKWNVRNTKKSTIPDLAQQDFKPMSLTILFELILAVYCGYGLSLYLAEEKYLIGPFLALYTAGFAYVGLLSLSEVMGSWFSRKRGSEIDMEEACASPVLQEEKV